MRLGRFAPTTHSVRVWGSDTNKGADPRREREPTRTSIAKEPVSNTPARRQNPSYKAWKRRYRKRLSARMISIVEAFKAAPCLDCGITYPSWMMDCDHTRGIKRADLSQMVGHLGLQAITAELAKCDPVCANCHRHRTYQRAQSKKKFSSRHPPASIA